MLNIVVIAEAASDAEIVCGLADRVFVENGNIPEGELPFRRAWIGMEPNSPFTQKEHISKLFFKSEKGSGRQRFLGYVEGQPQKSHAAFWRKMIQEVVNMGKSQPIEGMLIHQDTDNKPEQQDGMKQARDEVQDLLAIVLATPKREMEAWILNGFKAENQGEKKLLAELKRKLRFDPCQQAERARDNTGVRDPKNIVRALLKDHKNIDDRKRRCWRETPLATLKLYKETNLAAFLEEVETRFLPRLSNFNEENKMVVL